MWNNLSVYSGCCEVLWITNFAVEQDTYKEAKKLACDVTSNAPSDEIRLWSHKWRHLTGYIRWQWKKVKRVEFNLKKHDDELSIIASIHNLA